jgi:hypothetical protein
LDRHPHPFLRNYAAAIEYAETIQGSEPLHLGETSREIYHAVVKQSPLKTIFQCELHNPGVLRTQNSPECVGIIQSGSGIRKPDAIQHVERFSPDFQFLTLPNRKDSGQGQVELPE